MDIIVKILILLTLSCHHAQMFDETGSLRFRSHNWALNKNIDI